MEEVIIVGAGPCGLSAALEIKRMNINPLLIEKQVLVNSIYQYPTYMQFFSTPELLEIGGIPFTTPNEKPTRLEALHYYRNTALRNQLRIHSYETVVSVVIKDSVFHLETVNRFGAARGYQAKFVIIATGYFDHPNLLGIPGEDLPKVSHLYKEAHPYTGMKVTIIGGNNSAVDAALDLQRVGAEVTMVYRGPSYSPNIKPWVRPIFESMVNKGSIRMMFHSQVSHINETTITISGSEGDLQLDNDFVLALTGFRPQRNFLSAMGVLVEGEYAIPYYNPATMETNVEGLYIAGVISAGIDANEIFIETGRHHGALIAAHMMEKSNE